MAKERTLFIDETGKVSFSHPSKYFILSGCSIPTDRIPVFQSAAENVIFKYWGSRKSYLRKYGVKHINFRASEIFSCSGPFAILTDPKLKKRFWNDVYSQILSRDEITYYIILVNKGLVRSKYSGYTEVKMLNASHRNLLKSFIYHIIQTNYTGEIVSESSADQDMALVGTLSFLQRNSRRMYGDPQLVNEKITSLSLINKNDNNIGAQIADLMAWTGENKLDIDSGIKSLADLRHEEKMLLDMFNRRARAKRGKHKYNHFLNVYT